MSDDKEFFDRWFSGSSVVDREGQPLVLYHSSPVAITEFDASKTRDGGFHFGTEHQARSRAVFNEGENLHAVVISAKRLLRAQDNGGFWGSVIARAKHQGYEGIVYLNRYEGVSKDSMAMARGKGKGDERNLSDARFRSVAPEAEDSYIVFDPAQIQIVSINGASVAPSDSHAGIAENATRALKLLCDYRKKTMPHV